MLQNEPVPRFKLSSFSHFVTTASGLPKVSTDGPTDGPNSVVGDLQKGPYLRS